MYSYGQCVFQIKNNFFFEEIKSNWAEQSVLLQNRGDDMLAPHLLGIKRSHLSAALLESFSSLLKALELSGPLQAGLGPEILILGVFRVLVLRFHRCCRLLLLTKKQKNNNKRKEREMITCEAQKERVIVKFENKKTRQRCTILHV